MRGDSTCIHSSIPATLTDSFYLKMCYYKKKKKNFKTNKNQSIDDTGTETLDLGTDEENYLRFLLPVAN